MILKYIYKFTSVWHRCWLIYIQAIYIETMFTLFSVLFLLSFLVANLQTYFYINVLQLLVRFSSVIQLSTLNLKSHKDEMKGLKFLSGLKIPV